MEKQSMKKQEEKRKGVVPIELGILLGRREEGERV